MGWLAYVVAPWTLHPPPAGDIPTKAYYPVLEAAG
jgi:hypothetical protein